MPDVKWYASSSSTVSLTTGVTGTLPIANGGTNATSFTTTNGVVKWDATRLVTGAWIDTGTLLYSTTASGVGVGTATPLTVLGTVALNNGIQVTGADNTGVVVVGETSANIFAVDSNATANARIFGLRSVAGLGTIYTYNDAFTVDVSYITADLATDALTIGAAAVTGITLNPGTGEISTTAGASLNIGNGATAPASNYLTIGGVSGAGGTPTATHLTDGDGVAIYTQQAHDAQATKFVIAYNIGGTIRYLVATLDGATATWTNSATRP